MLNNIALKYMKQRNDKIQKNQKIQNSHLKISTTLFQQLIKDRKLSI